MTKEVPPSVTVTMWLADGSISNELTGDRSVAGQEIADYQSVLCWWR